VETGILRRRPCVLTNNRACSPALRNSNQKTMMLAGFRNIENEQFSIGDPIEFW